MRHFAGAFIAASLATAILLALVWVSQSSLGTQLGLPSGLRMWTPAFAAFGIALVVLPLVVLMLQERRYSR